MKGKVFLLLSLCCPHTLLIANIVETALETDLGGNAIEGPHHEELGRVDLIKSHCLLLLRGAILKSRDIREVLYDCCVVCHNINVTSFCFVFKITPKLLPLPFSPVSSDEK